MKDFDMNNVNTLRQEFLEAPAQALLSTKVVQAYMGLSKQWFDGKAVYGDGIPFIKLAHKRMYNKQDVLDWINRNAVKVCSTSEYIKPINDNKNNTKEIKND